MKPIPGYSGYFATERGEIVSVREGFERVLKSNSHKGYLRVNVKRDGDKARTQTDVHKLVLIAYKGDKTDPTHQCRHLNGRAPDNAPDNLRWGTAKENYADAGRHGTQGCGERHSSAKLKAAAVLRIHARAIAGEKQINIAKDYGITQRHVSDIKRMKTWRHLWDNEHPPMAPQISTAFSLGYRPPARV